MEEWYCSLEGNNEKLPCLQMRMQSTEDKEERKAMKAEMLEAMRARKDADLRLGAHDEMFERWCAEGDGPGVGSEPCDQWERRRTRRGEAGTRPPRSEAHEERIKMMEWYCSDVGNGESSNCLHQELRRAAELTTERRKEVMEKIQARMSDHEAFLKDTKDATEAWCTKDLSPGEIRAAPDSVICSRLEQKLARKAKHSHRLQNELR